MQYFSVKIPYTDHVVKEEVLENVKQEELCLIKSSLANCILWSSIMVHETRKDVKCWKENTRRSGKTMAG